MSKLILAVMLLVGAAQTGCASFLAPNHPQGDVSGFDFPAVPVRKPYSQQTYCETTQSGGTYYTNCQRP